MTWKIIWSEFAEKELDRIYEYYQENASPQVAKRLLVGIIKAPNRLLKNREMGPIEDQLMVCKKNTDTWFTKAIKLSTVLIRKISTSKLLTSLTQDKIPVK